MEKLRKANKVQDISIGVNDGHARTANEKAEIAAFAKAHNKQRTPECLIKNEMLAIRYKMEEYVQDQNIAVEEILTIKDFVKDFLKALKLKKGEFANHIEINDSNLNKYYNNTRPFNPILAMKFGHFFHTPADLWMKVQYKNDLIRFQVEIKSEKKYEKYDYKKVLEMA